MGGGHHASPTSQQGVSRSWVWPPRAHTLGQTLLFQRIRDCTAGRGGGGALPKNAQASSVVSWVVYPSPDTNSPEGVWDESRTSGHVEGPGSAQGHTGFTKSSGHVRGVLGKRAVTEIARGTFGWQQTWVTGKALLTGCGTGPIRWTLSVLRHWGGLRPDDFLKLLLNKTSAACPKSGSLENTAKTRSRPWLWLVSWWAAPSLLAHAETGPPAARSAPAMAGGKGAGPPALTCRGYRRRPPPLPWGPQTSLHVPACGLRSAASLAV